MAKHVGFDHPTPDSDLRQATGALIQNYAAWTWFGALTFGRPISEFAAYDVFKRWAKHVARDLVEAHVVVAFGLEPAGGSWHLHVLLSIPAEGVQLTGRQLDTSWKAFDSNAGFTKFNRFDPNRGAAWYLTKQDRWDVNVACSRPPKCRRVRCVEAPSSW